MKIKTNTYFLIVFLGLSILAPFSLDAYYLTLIIQAYTSVLVVLGLYLLQGMAGQISLGQAGFMALGGYAAAIFSIHLPTYGYLELPFVFIFSFFITSLISYPFIKWEGHTLAFGTLAFGYVVQLLVKSSESTGGGEGFGNIPALNAFGLKLTSLWELYIFTLIIILATFYIIHKTKLNKYGRIINTIKKDPHMLTNFGFKPSKYIYGTLIFSSVLAAAAGLIKVHLMSYVGPDMFSVELSIFFVVIIVVAGNTSPFIASLWAIFFSLLPEFLGKFDSYHTLIYSLVLIFVLLQRNKSKILSA